MDRERKSLLTRLMAVEFTAVDLNLYLDTHPEDTKALADYNMVTQELSVLKNQYENKYGPLFPYGMANSSNRWRWIEEPWPWEISF